MLHWQSVRVWLPIMELLSFFPLFFAFGLHILIKPYIKTIEYWCLCFLFFSVDGVVAINLFFLPDALRINK